jgi:hypothetical protein
MLYRFFLGGPYVFFSEKNFSVVSPKFSIGGPQIDGRKDLTIPIHWLHSFRLFGGVGFVQD